MSGPAPTVSIAIRAFRRRWLGQAIASVLGQTFRDLELVVYDDAGDLGDVVRGFDDPRVRMHPAAERLDASGRVVAAGALCRGRELGVLDDDDRYEPEFVATLLRALEADGEAGVAFCRVIYEARERTYEPPDPRPAGRQAEIVGDLLTHRASVPPSLMLVRREVLDALRPMPPGVAPDLYLHIAAAKAGWRHTLVDERLAVRRWHADHLSHPGLGAAERRIATVRAVAPLDGALEAVRLRAEADALVRRSLHLLAAGDSRSACRDLREAEELEPTAGRRARARFVAAGARVSVVGSLAARAAVGLARLRARRFPRPLVR